MSLLSAILWPKKRQFLGASLGLFIGFFLILLALQVFLDLRLVLQGARDENILVLNKEVKQLSASKSLSSEEIANLAKQGFVRDLAPFESNRFQASAVSEALGFRTELFLQAIPLRFLDVDSSDFSWQEGDSYVPIVLSSDYLALYNFGFAPSQGLPQFTASTIGLLTLDLRLRGRGKLKQYQAKIVGFTRNVNSILVPQNFLAAANAELGEESSAGEESSQLILDVENPYSQALQNFLDEQGYEISRGGLIGAELKALLYVLLALLLLIALIILALSLLVFILNYQLLISSAKKEVRLLLHLGFPHKDIEQKLAQHFLRAFFLASGLGSLAVLLPKYLLSELLLEQGYMQISLLPNISMPLAALGLMFLCIFVYKRSISRYVRRLA